jgi:hypothetical protein
VALDGSLPPQSRYELRAGNDSVLQAKQAHWNIKGPNFVGLHQLFDQVAAQAGEYGDAIADATALNDADTADLFTEVSRGVDKSLWMVEAHLQDSSTQTKQVEQPSASRESNDAFAERGDSQRSRGQG